MADPREDPLSPGREIDWRDPASRHLAEAEPDAEREELAEQRAAGEVGPDRPEQDQEPEVEPERETQELEQLEEAEQEALEQERGIERERAREHREPAEEDAARRDRELDEERGDLRAEAAGERRVGREDDARATALDYRAAGDDGPRADAERTKADRLRASAAHQDRIADYDDASADELAADGQGEARAAGPSPDDGSQPPAAEAVRNPPRGPRARRSLRNRTQAIQRHRERRR